MPPGRKGWGRVSTCWTGQGSSKRHSMTAGLVSPPNDVSWCLVTVPPGRKSWGGVSKCWTGQGSSKRHSMTAGLVSPPNDVSWCLVTVLSGRKGWGGVSMLVMVPLAWSSSIINLP